MINVATVHWKSRAFQGVQRRHLDRNLAGCRVWAFVDRMQEGSDEDGLYHFHADSGETNHLVKLDMLADMICRSSGDGEVILFLDGDAWPVAPIGGLVSESLQRHPLGAVVRRENGERYPHPCFMYTTVGYWRSAGLTWSGNEINYNLKVLESRGDGWTRLFRTGGLSDHPVFFSIYGDAVYHHGAGFRVPVSAYCSMNGVVVTKEQSAGMLDVFLDRFGDAG